MKYVGWIMLLGLMVGTPHILHTKATCCESLEEEVKELRDLTKLLMNALKEEIKLNQDLRKETQGYHKLLLSTTSTAR